MAKKPAMDKKVQKDFMKADEKQDAKLMKKVVAKDTKKK
jgi:hypothetical protein